MVCSFLLNNKVTQLHTQILPLHPSPKPSPLGNHKKGHSVNSQPQWTLIEEDQELKIYLYAHQPHSLSIH